jgi:SNF2 family DNA or RNA helicase
MTVWRMSRFGGARIIVDTGGFDPDLDKQFKTLPRPVRFDPNRQAWSLPMIWEVCVGVRQLATRHGAVIRIDPKLAKWAREERKRIDAIPDVQSTKREALPVLEKEAPKAFAAINNRPFQTVGAKFIAMNRSALIADEPGLGKSIQTISGLIEAKVTGPILIIGPKAAVEQTWPRQINQWLSANERVTHIGADDKPEDRVKKLRRAVEFGNAARFSVMAAAEGKEPWSQKRSWVLISPNYIRQRTVIDPTTGRQVMDKGRKVIDHVREALPELFDVEWSAVVVDEAHQTLAGATGNVKKQSAQRQGIGALKVKRNGYRVALSGTPFRGKPENLWGILNWLRPDLYRSYWKWTERHFEVMSDYFGMIIGDLKDETRFYEEAASVMIRRTKAEVAPDLPPKLYGGEHLDWNDDTTPIAVWLPMKGAQKRQYDSMVKDAVAQLGNATLMANGTFSEQTRSRQLACSAGQMVNEVFYPKLPSNKFDWILEFLDERGIDKTLVKAKPPKRAKTPKIVVASQFTKLLNLYSDELAKRGIKSFLYTGETKKRDRAAIVKDWQTNPASDTRVLFLNLAAGGTALDLDAYADELVTVDEPWKRDDEEQVEDRIHRLSNMHQVTIWRLRSLGSLEEGIARNTTRRDRNIKAILDGERGVAFAMKILSPERH